jgi:hypothetical protein
MVEKGIVGRNGGIRFVFYNGAEIEVGVNSLFGRIPHLLF